MWHDKTRRHLLAQSQYYNAKKTNFANVLLCWMWTGKYQVLMMYASFPKLFVYLIIVIFSEKGVFSETETLSWKLV